MLPAMKVALWILPSCGLALALSSCGNGGAKNAGAGLTPGPFDSRGNYVEEWADNPSKWRKPGNGPSPHETNSDQLADIALKDQPPQNSVPLAPSGSRPTTVISKTNVTSKPIVRSTQTSSTRSESTTVKAKPKTTTSSTKSKSSTASTKAKSKPKTARYTVKKGDSLSAIASRNGTSLAALKRANGISGSTIRPGQSLTIPK